MQPPSWSLTKLMVPFELMGWVLHQPLQSARHNNDHDKARGQRQ